MTECRESFVAGEPLVLPSGRTLLLVWRTRTLVQSGGPWRSALVEREPHAVLLQEVDGRLSALAAGSEVVSLAALGKTVPNWERVLGRLRHDHRGAGAGTRL